MDELLDYCFLKALKTTAKKIDLPVLTSNFYRLHIVPACPADKSLDVKKSSFKKLSKFLEVKIKKKKPKFFLFQDLSCGRPLRKTDWSW